MILQTWIKLSHLVLSSYVSIVRLCGAMLFRVFVFCYCGRMNKLRAARRSSSVTSAHHPSSPLIHSGASQHHQIRASSSLPSTLAGQNTVEALPASASSSPPGTPSPSLQRDTQSQRLLRSHHHHHHHELSEESKHLLAAVILMGHQIPSLMISYRPTIQTLYGRGISSATSAFVKSHLVHPHAIMHYSSSTHAQGPTIVWLCMPWEFTSQTSTKFLQRLGTATGCNVLAVQVILDGDLTSPSSYPQQFSALLQSIVAPFRHAPLLLGAADLAGTFALQVIAQYRSLFVGCFLLDPFLGWSDVSFLQGGAKPYLIHAVESVVGSQQIRSWFPTFQLLRSCQPQREEEGNPAPPTSLVPLPPTVCLMNVDGFWFTEQLQFDHRFSRSVVVDGETCIPEGAKNRELVVPDWDLQCLPFRITPSPSTSFTRFWDTSEVDSLLHQSERWIRELVLHPPPSPPLDADGFHSTAAASPPRTSRLERNISYGSSMTRLDGCDSVERLDSLDSMEGIFTSYVKQQRPPEVLVVEPQVISHSQATLGVHKRK